MNLRSIFAAIAISLAVPSVAFEAAATPLQCQVNNQDGMVSRKQLEQISSAEIGQPLSHFALVAPYCYTIFATRPVAVFRFEPNPSETWILIYYHSDRFAGYDFYFPGKY